MTWGDVPGVYDVTLECPDKRWWRGNVLASSRDDAIAAARAGSGMPDAPLLLCSKVSGAIEAEVLDSVIEEPRGWEPGSAG